MPVVINWRKLGDTRALELLAEVLAQPQIAEAAKAGWNSGMQKAIPREVLEDSEAYLEAIQEGAIVQPDRNRLSGLDLEDGIKLGSAGQMDFSTLDIYQA